MNSRGNPYVIEYNARLGDPESEVIIPRIKSDLFELLEGVSDGTLANRGIIIDNRVAATVMLVSGGYPGEYQKGKVIKGLEKTGDSIVFHAGTGFSGNEVVTAGGRVVSVTSLGKEMIDALNQSYRSAELIEFEGVFYRKDIGFDLKGR
jgi:phosphoribosylamine--glycine ligase